MLRRRSYGSVTTTSLCREEVVAALARIAARVAGERPEFRELWLIGSVARGDHTGTSDVDVLVVVDSPTEENPVDRIRSYLPLFDLPVAVDVLVWTTHERDERLAAGDRLALLVAGEGVRIHPAGGTDPMRRGAPGQGG